MATPKELYRAGQGCSREFTLLKTDLLRRRSFAFLKPYLRPDVLRMLEYGRKVDPVGKIRDGVRYLSEIGIL